MDPVVRLETLNSRQTKWVLAITYIAVVLCVVLNALETGWDAQELRLGAAPCSAASSAGRVPGTHRRPCAQLENGTTTWTSRVTLSKLEQYFGVSVRLRASAHSAQAPLQVAGRIVVRGLEGAAHHRVGPVLADERFSSSASYGDEVALLDERDWMFSQNEMFDAHVVSVHFDGEVDLGSSSEFIVYHHSAAYRRANMVLRTMGMAFGTAMILWWCNQLRLLGWDSVLREQWWVTGVLVTATVCTDPLYIPLMLNQTRLLWTASGVVVELGLCSMLFFWMLLLHGASGYRPRRDWAMFTLPKLAVCGTIYLALTLMNVFNTVHRSRKSVGPFAALLVVSFLAWLVMMYRYQRSTHAKLLDLPYATSRFRQLSYRFFVTQSISIIIYFVFSSAFRRARVVRNLGEYFTTFATSAIAIAYVSLIAYLYSPPAQAVKDAVAKRVRADGGATEPLLPDGGVPSVQHDGAGFVIIGRQSSFLGDLEDSGSEFGGGVGVSDNDDDDGLFGEHALIVTTYPPRSGSFAEEAEEAEEDPEDAEMVRTLSTKARVARRMCRPVVPMSQHARLIRRQAKHAKLGEQHLSIRDILGGGRSSVAHLPTCFDLHVAMWMLYFSLQAYYDFPDPQPPEGGGDGDGCGGDALPGLPLRQRHLGRNPSTKSACGVRDIIGEFFGFSLVRVLHNAEADVHGYVAVRGSVCVCAFRGTASARNARTDISFVRKEATMADGNDSDGGSVHLHGGFYEAFQAIEGALLQAVANADSERADHAVPMEVVCTGHSLGGALATLAAFTLSKRGWHAQMYSFGSPRVGNHAFAALFDNEVPQAYRVCCDRDVVTTLPKMCNLFKHIGTEALVDPLGNILVAPTWVEKVFRPRRTSMAAHLMKHYLECMKRACVVAERLVSASTGPLATSSNLQLMEHGEELLLSSILEQACLDHLQIRTAFGETITLDSAWDELFV